MISQIGWIDFSEKDRKKALGVIHLLQEQGAVDELGIGIVRDAFADYFFPGTSTVQTRAKYFLIIPYVMKEVCSNMKFKTVEQIIKAIDAEEYRCAEIMAKREDNDGVIGKDVLPGWVERRPSNIYWNGLKKLGIFTYPGYSITEYYREELKRRSWSLEVKESGKRNGVENEQDDDKAYASGLRSYWNLPPEYGCNRQWKDTLSIGLLPWEASWLRECISRNLNGSLFKFIIDNNINVGVFTSSVDSFRALSESIVDRADEKMKAMIMMANRFNSLVFLSRILYNIILSDGYNEKANSLWMSERHRLEDIGKLRIDEMTVKLGIWNPEISKFLKEMQWSLTEGDIDAAKDCIIRREIRLKGRNRAKLQRKTEFKGKGWIGGKLLDYRFDSAARIIMDIYKAENNGYVQM